jgi:hypothetical protein
VIADEPLRFVLGHIPGTRPPIDSRLTPWHALIEVDLTGDLREPDGPVERLEGAAGAGVRSRTNRSG